MATLCYGTVEGPDETLYLVTPLPSIAMMMNILIVRQQVEKEIEGVIYPILFYPSTVSGGHVRTVG